MKLSDNNCICDKCLYTECPAKRIIMDLQKIVAHVGHNDVRVTFESSECLKPERRYTKEDQVNYPKRKGK